MYIGNLPQRKFTDLLLKLQQKRSCEVYRELKFKQDG